MKNQLNHIAIIMDGNGRWAQQQGKERSYGHQHGVEAVRNAVECACEEQIPYLTLYAFSTENWNRPQQEVELLMRLLTSAIANELPMLQENNIRLRTTGRIENLPDDCITALNDAIQKTASNTDLTLTLALSYGGRAEIVDTFKKITEKISAGTLKLDEISESAISENLYNPDIPDVDILIRTGGDMRISNFLLWEIAYAELFFIDTMWPDFQKDDLRSIISSFKSRERRFGKTGEQVQK